MIDSYQKLCNYIMELDENNKIALAKARMGHDIYGHSYFDSLNTEDIIYLLKNKIKEIEENNWHNKANMRQLYRR